jgi:hypothetical protein
MVRESEVDAGTSEGLTCPFGEGVWNALRPEKLQRD